ncbi:PadR family transcriptional regulator [Paenibacillus radicis (ex Gao et al. 2016)]|uniref:PadR family transcriptional regulator n=1 Tax=Paenibacillus radicis (ex Gao et al. 2016) TaxID=1737354 RepID=A0A917LWD1_9BACL|nr:PadR family transcriptional regulator [Paenibacillus radicis (ex Gao et al. 2016)]GGG62211.1 PadR family transcriptional regulator [Paenibacillus radicis (ex Gao et al. 2016)]
MNTLSYGLLALLSVGPRTGYDLSQRVKPLWQAGHSQIYPLLSQLEQSGYITFELIEQSDKPDKKEYTITESGLAELSEWVGDSAGKPVLKDDLHIKLYAIWLAEPEKARQLLQARAAFCLSELERYQLLMDNVEKDRSSDGGKKHFGRYLLIRKRVMDVEANLQFCKWALSELGS